jgi:hypothetical protein
MNSDFSFKHQESKAWINAPLHKIEYINWPEFSYKPDVKFKIVLVRGGLYIQFCVDEDDCKGIVTDINGPVYKDSCVEFFVRPANEGIYYNFEFNCIGNILLACGISRHNRVFAPTEIIEKILRKPSLGGKPLDINGRTKWELDVFIPFIAFFQHKIESLERMYCNFYKCGDETRQKHYLTWMPVKTERPDFHRPEYFGILEI